MTDTKHEEQMREAFEKPFASSPLLNVLQRSGEEYECQEVQALWQEFCNGYAFALSTLPRMTVNDIALIVANVPGNENDYKPSMDVARALFGACIAKLPHIIKEA